MSPNIQSSPTSASSQVQRKAAPVVVAMHPKRDAMLLQRIDNAAIAPPRSAVVLASPPGTLLSTLTVLPHLRLGLAQIAARGLGCDTSQGGSDPRSHAPFTSMNDFYQRLGAVRTAVGWDQWNASSSQPSPPSVMPSSVPRPPTVTSATTVIGGPASAARSLVPPSAAPASAGRIHRSPPRTSTPVTAGTQHLDAAFSRIQSARRFWQAKDAAPTAAACARGLPHVEPTSADCARTPQTRIDVMGIADPETTDAAFDRVQGARRFWQALDVQAARPANSVPLPHRAASSPVMRPTSLAVPTPAPQRDEARSPSTRGRYVFVPPTITTPARPEPQPELQRQPLQAPQPRPQPVRMPTPSPELLQAMRDSNRVSPDMMRLEDLIRGRTPKPSAAMPHPWHHYPTKPQRSELHPFGIYRALHSLRC